MEIKVFLPNRSYLPEYLNQKGLLGRGAEIGVQKGEFSTQLLRTWRGQKLYMIDVWRYLDGYMDIANLGDMYSNMRCYAQTFSNVYQFGDRAVIIRDFSVAASQLFPEKSLDFVYLDADHSYEGVKKDIEAWFPKVRPGGVFCGDDFIDANCPSGIFGVRQAVTEFAESIGKDIKTTAEGDYPNWVIEL